MKQTALRTLRFQSGCTVREVVRALEITERYFAQIELGQVSVSYGKARRLARLYGCSLDALLSAVQCVSRSPRTRAKNKLG